MHPAPGQRISAGMGRSSWEAKESIGQAISESKCYPRSDSLISCGEMCGIFGYVGPQDPVPIIMGGLRSLEYRGYDSAGIAIVEDGKLQVRRASGKLKNLEELL